MSMNARTQQADEGLGLLIAGYVMAFVLPIGGIIAGIAIANRRLGHGMAIALLSTSVAIAWVLLILELVG